jgi:hypothetical protein
MVDWCVRGGGRERNVRGRREEREGGREGGGEHKREAAA